MYRTDRRHHHHCNASAAQRRAAGLAQPAPPPASVAEASVPHSPWPEHAWIASPETACRLLVVDQACARAGLYHPLADARAVVVVVVCVCCAALPASQPACTPRLPRLPASVTAHRPACTGHCCCGRLVRKRPCALADGVRAPRRASCPAPSARPKCRPMAVPWPVAPTRRVQIVPTPHPFPCKAALARIIIT